jgi:hypothetical protein
MKRLIELNAPAIVIRMEAELLLTSFRCRTPREWLWKNLLAKQPNWLLRLVSKRYREIDDAVNRYENDPEVVAAAAAATALPR